MTEAKGFRIDDTAGQPIDMPFCVDSLVVEKGVALDFDNGEYTDIVVFKVAGHDPATDENRLANLILTEDMFRSLINFGRGH